MGVLKFMADDESVMLGPGEVWASCCINNGSTAGSIYSNNGGGPWQCEWEVIYEIQYILPAHWDVRQCEFSHSRQSWM